MDGALRPPVLGIVVPTLDEAEFLPGLLDDLARLTLPHRVVVSDGGSRDATLAVARAGGAWPIWSPRGRARQLNSGAAVLNTPWLLFLHADSRLPLPARAALASFLRDAPLDAAAFFRFQLDAPGWKWRTLEWGQRIREAVTGWAYGDQGLLLSQRRFRALGGFPDIPIMEDVEMIRRLRDLRKPERLPAALPTSTRRYREEGWMRAGLRNLRLLTLHRLGVPPESLAPRYPARRPSALPPTGSPPKRTLLVFAKAPRSGEVKTRLAAELGADPAAAIYRRMGRDTLDRLRDGAWETVVCYTPADSLEEVQHWLNPQGLSFLVQQGAELGARLTHAFDRVLSPGGVACVVGTDIPDLDQTLVEAAFRRLEDPDGPEVVLGPALDGGYYLLGLRSPRPELFREIAWSTAAVRAQTLARAAGSGLRVDELPPLADVDEPDDVPPSLLPREALGD
jgi:rSAM/selenodomain-associated transferase 2/rSAM/selenodomain-associated transferase 1